MARNAKHLRPPLISIDGLIKRYAKDNSNIHCFQIGANDGIFDDPLRTYITQYKWKSLLVEPLKDVYQQQLTKNYEGYKNVILENCAIDNKEGEREIFKIGFTSQPWALGLTSFNKENIQKHIDSGYVDRMAAKSAIFPPADQKDYIATEKVKTSSVITLLRKHSFEKVNVLAIDTEGFDFEILKLMDFKNYHPDLILYESKHLNDEDFVLSQDFLRKLGYVLYWEKGNTLAIDKRTNKQFSVFLKLHLFLSAFLKKL